MSRWKDVIVDDVFCKIPHLFQGLFKSIPREKWKHFMNPPAGRNQAYIPTPIEHLANVVTHLLGVLPSFYGMRHLLELSTTWTQTLCAVLYGSALLLLFTISSLFHSIFFIDKHCALKRVLHRLDRAAIYFFIASASTPWLMLKTYNSCGQLYLVWLLSILGIVYQNVYHEKYKTLELIIYCVDAFLPFTALCSMKPSKGFSELCYGGVIYMIGTVFFKLDGRVPFAHAIWHLFVDAAALVHYQAVRIHLFNGF